jgi:hypothetical protein
VIKTQTVPTINHPISAPPIIAQPVLPRIRPPITSPKKAETTAGTIASCTFAELRHMVANPITAPQTAPISIPRVWLIFFGHIEALDLKSPWLNGWSGFQQTMGPLNVPERFELSNGSTNWLSTSQSHRPRSRRTPRQQPSRFEWGFVA